LFSAKLPRLRRCKKASIRNKISFSPKAARKKISQIRLNFEVQKKLKKFRIYSEFLMFFAGKIHVTEGKAQEKGGFQKVVRREEGQARQEEAAWQGQS
jgi:hypothetical protein